MQHLTSVPVPRQHQPATPEAAGALKTLRAADFRLEAEFYHLDIESRFELAEELRAVLDDLTDHQADELAHVISDLEDLDGSDFSEWEVRCDAAARVRRVVRSVESESKDAAVSVF